MENASKALIIAGAVLIAILLITMGVMIFKSTEGLQNSVGKTSESMAVATFNSQFTSYLGNNLSSVQIKMLLSRIIANNADTPTAETIGISGDLGNDVASAMSALNVGKRYNTVGTFDLNTGRLSNVEITEYE